MSERTASHGEARRWVAMAAASETDECLLWPFKAMAGQVKRPVIGRSGRGLQPVTHLVLEMAGRPLSSGEQANHTCDEPLCCNPAHLYAGSQHQNVRDAIRRGRMPGLADDVIEEIGRLSATMGYKRIAKHLGVPYYAARYHARRARRAVA